MQYLIKMNKCPWIIREYILLQKLWTICGANTHSRRKTYPVRYAPQNVHMCTICDAKRANTNFLRYGRFAVYSAPEKGASIDNLPALIVGREIEKIVQIVIQAWNFQEIIFRPCRFQKWSGPKNISAHSRWPPFSKWPPYKFAVHPSSFIPIFCTDL
jgi:hypothetical protein